MEKVRYNHLNTFLKNKFGTRTLKICVDGGFSCPNRDVQGKGGCIFCGVGGAGENIKYKCHNIYLSIENQINGFLNSYRGKRADKFIVYFQSYSNTFDTVDNLKKRYDLALGVSNKIIGLDIATRPDCISEDVAKLLSSYQDKYYVCVELGLQTSNDEIGKIINRGYTTNQFENAVKILHKYKIDVVAHIMVGLPSENEQDIIDTVEFINRCDVAGVKIHSTYIQKDTVLNDMYLLGEYTPITIDYYVKMVGEIVGKLKPNIVIHRINADPPKNLFVAPDWMLHKKIVINTINKYLDDNDIYEGKFYDKTK